MFGLFGGKKAKQQEPLERFDAQLAAFERRASLVRESAATLVALQRELRRTQAERTAAVQALRDRTVQARMRGEAVEPFEQDQADAGKALEATREALARCEADAELLLEVARELGRKLSSLRLERERADVALRAGEGILSALAAAQESFSELVALDEARDEVERAHVLADLYRQDHAGRR